jgi:cytochrome b6-f complex iron-sulfur subunit
MTIALMVLATATGLAALAFWWIRRNNMAVPAAVPASLSRTAPNCALGQQLLMASNEAGGGGGGGGGDGPAPRPTRKKRGPTRRAFLRYSMGASLLGVLAGFGGATLAMLWPSLRAGFGAVLDVGDEEEILNFIRANNQPFEFPAGRMYIVEYDPDDDRLDEYQDLTGGARLMAIYQVCVHLGCKVPWCQTSQWFECPCHGSRYNRWGEFRGGPAPRGLDRFECWVEEGRFIVDTSTILTGPSRQLNSLDQPPEGASCL